MRIVIIEDDLKQQDKIEKLVKDELPEAEIIGKAQSVRRATDLLKRNEIDLAIMDVMIKGGTTFDVLEAVDNFSFYIIFTTSFEEYAVQAFRKSAIDYLLKPIDSNEFSDALKKVERRQLEKGTRDQFEILFSSYRQDGIDKRIALPDNDDYIFVYPKDIVKCESVNNYSKVFMTNKKSVLVNKTLKSLEQVFSGLGFYRVHNQVLINTRHIEKISKSDDGRVLLSDGSEVGISRRRKDEFLRFIQKI